jgi:hypothetical protein
MNECVDKANTRETPDDKLLLIVDTLVHPLNIEVLTFKIQAEFIEMSGRRLS